MIKVLYAVSDGNIGGAGKCVLSLLENIDRHVFYPGVVLPQGSLLTEHIRELDVRCIEVDVKPDKSFSLASIRPLKRAIKGFKPDILHAHGQLSARIAGRLAKVRKIIFTRHSVFPPKPYLTTGIGKRLYGDANNRLADGIIAVADAAKQNLVDMGVDPDIITVILNGVKPLPKTFENDKRQFRERYGIKDEKVLSIAARLTAVKGHEYILEAAKALLERGVKFKIIIAGTGDAEVELKELRDRLGLQGTVLFTGFLSDVEPLLSITDITLNASYGTEATSLALLESMSLGIPAIVTNYGGNPGVIEDGVNGLTVPIRDSAALADAIYKLLNDNALYYRLIDGANRIFSERFTAEVMTRNTEEYYKKLLDN